MAAPHIAAGTPSSPRSTLLPMISFWGGQAPQNEKKKKKLQLPVKLTVSLTDLIFLLTTPWQLAEQCLIIYFCPAN